MTGKSIGPDYLISFQPCEGLLALVMFPMSGCMCTSSDNNKILSLSWVGGNKKNGISFLFLFRISEISGRDGS